MFSAYFGYIFPIVVGAIFIAFGFALFRFPVWILRVPGTLGMLVGLALILWILISSPTPWHRTATFEHIFHTPPQQIIKLRIRANSPCPLVTKDLTVTDRESLRQIALALGHASEVENNGPPRWDIARFWVWHDPIELTTSDGTFYFRAGVCANGRGAFAVVGTERDGYGWYLGSFRAEEFARVLEQLRDKAAQR